MKKIGIVVLLTIISIFVGIKYANDFPWQDNLVIWFGAFIVGGLAFFGMFFTLYKGIQKIGSVSTDKRVVKIIFIIIITGLILVFLFTILIFPKLLVSCFALPEEYNVKNRITGSCVEMSVACGDRVPWYYVADIEKCGEYNPYIPYNPSVNGS